MLSDAITTTDLAIYLGIYASVISTAAGFWVLFSGVVRDRARIQVKAAEAFFLRSFGSSSEIVGAGMRRSKPWGS